MGGKNKIPVVGIAGVYAVNAEKTFFDEFIPAPRKSSGRKGVSTVFCQNIPDCTAARAIRGKRNEKMGAHRKKITSMSLYSGKVPIILFDCQ